MTPAAFTDPKGRATSTALLHYRLQPIAAFPSPEPAAHLYATDIHFELTSSDITLRKPYLDAQSLHVYLPIAAVDIVLMRLELSLEQMGRGGVYAIDSLLGFLGDRCACGEDHWKSMGWKTGAKVVWPGEIGVDREGVARGIEQLEKALKGGRITTP